MENPSRKILIIDEGAFHLPPATDEKIRENAGVFAFAYEAQEDFDIIVATDKDIGETRESLKIAALQRGVIFPNSIQDDFLIKAVTSWRDCDNIFADVFIGHPDTRYKIDHTIYFKPDALIDQNSYYYFWKNYDDDLSGFAQSAAWLSANVELHRLFMQRAMAKTYKSPTDVWKKVASHPAIKELADKIGEAKQHGWEKEHPQARLLDGLKSYFEYISVRKQGAQFQSAKNAADCRTYLKADFVIRNIDHAYNRPIKEIMIKSPTEYPLIPDHRRLLNKALLAIHGIVKAELTLKS